MVFNINKGATLPILKMELIDDGRNDYQRFFEIIQNANIVFSMTEISTGIKKIGRRPAYCMLVDPANDCSGDKYFITFQFTNKDTAKAGKFVGQFEITFLDGTGVLIVPIKEELFINVIEGSIKGC